MYKTLLVHLDDNDSRAPRVAAAAELARRAGGHLIGQYSLTDLFAPVYTDIPIPADMYDIQYRQAMAAADDNKRWFTEQLSQTGCEGEWRLIEDDSGDYSLVRAACSVDLVVVSQRLGGDPLDGSGGFVGRVVVRSPAPVLVVPEQGAAGPIGRRVLVAWNDSRESARAVSDALALLAQAEHVVVSSVTPSGDSGGGERGERLLRYLALHGVRAEIEVCEGSYGETGAKLLGRAAAADCDLIVAGGYGHSRLREVIFGGVTQHLIGHTTVPLLMAH